MEINEVNLALDEAVRALRDIAGLDPTRPEVSLPPEEVAVRALRVVSSAIGRQVAARGRTPRPGEARDYPLLHDGAYDL